ncbi:tail protein X [Marinobacterium stanieri]|uniref:p2-like prophage tail protein X n=1 Tax=Marinobacterium stanieri TaxID=49186 RepID=A0A1N6Q271_9GAMM|nr:tail protein X [Marinobacterium stanieri]SIQ10680.1 P2-like prophage tail protein X [Marinobacterium stanieri]
MATQVRAQQGDTVDLICHRHYGRTGRVTEAVLDANPGLCELGPVLPHGHLVTLPDQTETAPVSTIIQLWD